MKILLTGATGFLGSHLLKHFVEKGYEVVILKRTTSDLFRLQKYAGKYTSYDVDKQPISSIFAENQIDIVVHTAWQGVSASERNDWDVQMKNFHFSKELIDASAGKVRKIICLGSQAEYGIYKEKVTENQAPKPVDAYGAVKLLTLYYLDNIAKKNDISWNWVRVFSILGENENKNWLLSQVIDTLSQNKEIQLTAGEQYYDYMYVEDFVKSLEKLIISEQTQHNIYNICTAQPTKIRDLLQLVAQELKVDKNLLKFGAIPYRENQNMFMVGSAQRFENEFGKQSFSEMKQVIQQIIKSINESK